MRILNKKIREKGGLAHVSSGYITSLIGLDALNSILGDFFGKNYVS